MRLAIADPPYLGRARRWYGPDGRGHGAGRGRADEHPDAGVWDVPQAHRALVVELEANFDGWAIAMTPGALATYMPIAPERTRLAIWTRGNAIPTGSRVRGLWEPVLVRLPDERTAHATGPAVDDVLNAGITPGGFAGRKPEQWTHWVLALLGYVPGEDEVVDVFPGSGSVADAVATYSPKQRPRRRREAPQLQAQQVRRAARASTARKAAVLAALRAGGSVRAVAGEARISTNTVQRWKREAQLTGR
jgi:Homeodomain-like domain